MLLSYAMEGGDLAVAELVQNLGAEGAWAKIIEGVLGEPAAERAGRITIDVVERLAKATATRFIIPGGDEWPAGLDDLRHAESVQRRGGEPVGLWLRGPSHVAHLMERSVAIVGSRAATAYGSGIATDLAADLVEQGVTVVSGGAFGIDVAAHRGALTAGGPTVSVLANGVDVAVWRRYARTLWTRCSERSRRAANLRSINAGWLTRLMRPWHELDPTPGCNRGIPGMNPRR
jgi:DNA processing protein